MSEGKELCFADSLQHRQVLTLKNHWAFYQEMEAKYFQVRISTRLQYPSHIFDPLAPLMIITHINFYHCQIFSAYQSVWYLIIIWCSCLFYCFMPMCFKLLTRCEWSKDRDFSCISLI